MSLEQHSPDPVNKIQLFIRASRSLIFYFFWISFTLLWFIPSFLLALLLPAKAKHFIIAVFYSQVIIWAARIICGIKWQLIGKENLPSNNSGFIVLSKHQSTWETFFLTTLLYPQVPVVKAELAQLPIFGWMLSMLNPIWIDRTKKTNALKQVIEQGKQRLIQGVSVLVFPEGTRVPPGQRKTFSKGGALLATSTKAPVIAVAHNSGECWSNSDWVKKPGIIKVVISPVFNTETLTTKDLHYQVESWINQTVDKVSTVVFSGEYSQSADSGKRF